MQLLRYLMFLASEGESVVACAIGPGSNRYLDPGECELEGTKDELHAGHRIYHVKVCIDKPIVMHEHEQHGS